MSEEIKLLQFFVCEDFRTQKQDGYLGEGILSNLTVPSFPCSLDHLMVVTCWRKDKRFHKEVIEYETDYGTSIKTPHMDIEPVTDSVYFRWHKHQFPKDFSMDRPCHLTIRVILDWKPQHETYILIEQRP